MAEWIDELGNYLSQERSDKFRLTSEGHWQLKSGENWTTLPDHWKTGVLMMIVGGIGSIKSNNWIVKMLSLAGFVGGAYLVADDWLDLQQDIEKFLAKIKP